MLSFLCATFVHVPGETRKMCMMRVAKELVTAFHVEHVPMLSWNALLTVCKSYPPDALIAHRRKDAYIVLCAVMDEYMEKAKHTIEKLCSGVTLSWLSTCTVC